VRGLMRGILIMSSAPAVGRRMLRRIIAKQKSKKSEYINLKAAPKPESSADLSGGYEVGA
jgi:hypothetical protein